MKTTKLAPTKPGKTSETPSSEQQENDYQDPAGPANAKPRALMQELNTTTKDEKNTTPKDPQHVAKGKEGKDPRTTHTIAKS